MSINYPTEAGHDLDHLQHKAATSTAVTLVIAVVRNDVT